MSAAPTSVSVIVPVHDGARFLSEALRSVNNQTLPAGEIIVVVDGSSDGSADIVRREHPDVVLVRQSGAGAAEARNAGAQRARCEALASSTMMMSGCGNATLRCSTPGAQILRPTSSAAHFACWSSPGKVTTNGSVAPKAVRRRSWSARS
jgi:hypothetical protein